MEAASTEIVEPGARVVDPDWSPDGAWIAYRLRRRRDGRRWRADDRSARWQRRSPARGQCRAHRGLGPRRGLRGLHPRMARASSTSSRSPMEPIGWCRSPMALGASPGPRRFVTRAVPWWRPACLRRSHRCHPISPINEPAAGEPVKPDATWGGLAFRSPQDQELFDCRLAVLRFPDQLTVLEPERAAAPSPTQLRRACRPGTVRGRGRARGRGRLRLLRAPHCSRPVYLHACLRAGGDHRGRPHGRHACRRTDSVRRWRAHLVAGRRLDRKDELQRGGLQDDHHATGWFRSSGTGGLGAAGET